MKRKIALLAMMVTVSFSTLFGCGTDDGTNNQRSTDGNINNFGNGSDGIADNRTNNKAEDTVTSTKFDIEVNYSDKEKLSVTKEQLSSYSNVIELNNETVTISESGEYVLEGSIDDGKIIVDVPDTDVKVVTLILNGVDVACADSAAIYVKSADKVVLSLVEGTINTFKDGETYAYDDATEEEPNACIFSKDDLVISGNGTMNVAGRFNNGIASKDDLTITGGKINVTAVNNGIKGKDSIAILTSDITVEAGADGLKSDNTTDAEKGFIIIEDGTFDITSGEDGIQAETCMVINDGSFNVTTGEGAGTTSWENGNDWGKPGFEDFLNENTETTSIKAIKAGCDITVNNGKFEIDSEDDAIHTNVSITINGGIFNILSGDDGIHADSTLEINDGEITINQCYEGIESTDIVVNDGDIQIVSSDDGFNAAGGNDSSAMDGRPGMNHFGGTTGSLTFNGGYIYVNAYGDGIDANGTLEITDGYIVVDGPANSGNGAFDYGSGCTVTGGFILAVGYSQMAQMPSNASINCIMIGLNGDMQSGQLFNISDSNGDSVVTFSGAKSYNNIVLCTSDLKTGESYTINIGGEVSGDIVDGIGSGVYSGGTEYTTFTVENIITTVGNATGGMGGMGQRPDDMGGMGQRPDDMGGMEMPPGGGRR